MQKYPSISNNKQGLIKKFKAQCSEIDEWVVSEKCHGANISFLYDGQQIQVASRNELLGKPENVIFFFCGHHVVKWAEELRPLLTEVWQSRTVESVIVYGELMGGQYEHPEVDAHPDGRIIQGGQLQYCPNNMFYAFDIKVVYSDERIVWLDFDETLSLFIRHGIFHAQADFRGSLQDCLNYSQSTKSTQTGIPARLSLPIRENNIREGNIIRPVITRFLPKGNRIIIKDKAPEFREAVKIKVDPRLNDKEEELKHNMIQGLTHSRLQSLLSKTGPLQKSDIQGAIKGMVLDLIEELKNDEDPLYEEYSALNAKKTGWILSNLKNRAGDIVREHLKMDA